MPYFTATSFRRVRPTALAVRKCLTATVAIYSASYLAFGVSSFRLWPLALIVAAPLTIASLPALIAWAVYRTRGHSVWKRAAGWFPLHGRWLAVTVVAGILLLGYAVPFWLLYREFVRTR